MKRCLWLTATGFLTIHAWASDVAPKPNRWISIDEASIASRYVSAQDSAGNSVASQVQLQEAFGARLHLLSHDRFSIGAMVAPGGSFTAGWDNLMIGDSPSSFHPYLKQLYLATQPIDGVRFYFGGLGMERGGMTDLLDYHGQGFMTGQRLEISRPACLFFNSVSVTYGYVGDYNSPGINSRFHRLGQGNYQRYLVRKDLSRLSLTADYTNHAGSKVLRQGMKFSPSRRAGVVVLEVYERLNRTAAAGFHVGYEKAVAKRFSVQTGFLAVDRNYGDLNSDAFFHGRRAYVSPAFQINPSVKLFALFNHTVASSYEVPNRQHFEMGLAYDLRGMLARLGAGR